MGRISASLPRRRTVLKVMHWSMVPLLIWFILVTPDDVLPFGPKAFQAHSILALVFVTICLLWAADTLRRGLASRPGPKLPPWARRVHRWLHIALVWGLFLVAVGGFALGLTSPRLLKAGGFLPIAPPMNLREANEIIGTLHIYEFYLVAVLAGIHAVFHIWRHLRLRDNALRIMAPKALHRFL
ncbi:cytochrome b/b6 domain-containing protein [Sulfitobacter aestuariivivens]|uniref:Cytochrome b/b6 domain-containing protein n=1 Tax=Sulfitobacter aestuariivivens TaxID=2766981 RepID=A0A927D3M2_9RHOB|nr:cytochrome b/b6 domain-containing protein [Sulfitobacter aestuariivivens]MBD3662637.1 cytochrome b/b6 domain-containing protein [Sulfitobacter aestuariivivens]